MQQELLCLDRDPEEGRDRLDLWTLLLLRVKDIKMGLV